MYEDVCFYRRAGGYGVALDVWPFFPLAVCPRFVFEADHGVRNPSADFFYFASAHPLEGVDVPIGVYALRPT